MDDSEKIMTLASIFKEAFSIDWLQDLSSEKASRIMLTLETGVDRGILQKTGPGMFRFETGQRDIWEKRLAAAEREELHRRAFDLLLTEMPETEQKVDVLSHHLQQISNDLERCKWLLKAGDSFLASTQVEKAVKCYYKAIQDLPVLQENQSPVLFAESAVRLSRLSSGRLNTLEVITLLKQAKKQLGPHSHLDLKAAIDLHLAKNYWLSSQDAKVSAAFESGISHAERSNYIQNRKLIRTFQIFRRYWEGRSKEVIQIYEKEVPAIDIHPSSATQRLVVLTVCECYAHLGNFSQCLGMVDEIHKQAIERRDYYLASMAGIVLGAILRGMWRLEDAIESFQNAIELARQEHNQWALLLGRFFLAISYYQQGRPDRCIASLKQYLKQADEQQVTAQPYPLMLQICFAMEQGRLPRIPGLSLEKEIQRKIRGISIFNRGVAYRYKAILQDQSGEPAAKTIATLNTSLKWLLESGHRLGLTLTRMELARQYLRIGEEEQARSVFEQAYPDVTALSERYIPDELRPLIKEMPPDESLLNEILSLGQEAVTIREYNELAQHILSTVNRITGAERGALFLCDESGGAPACRLEASRNLTAQQIEDPAFRSSLKAIETVAESGKAQIMEPAVDPASGNEDAIRSRICVPMVYQGKVVGVLYHDNRLLRSAFKEADLKLLNYFAAQAAIGLNNAQAYDKIQQLSRKLREEKDYYEEEHLAELNFEDIIGESDAIRRVLRQIDQVAQMDTTVLILGETGVGKELVARAIHRHSQRSAEPFIRVHCSALPESLIPSELFGHEKGAFTGAIQRRIGRFELANKGTLFLDEIGELSTDIQVKLLRVLQTREFERVGGVETLHSDFRLIAATNRNLEQQVNERHFRDDLFYRINVFPIYVPPLRERKEDIPLLAYFFLKTHGSHLGKQFSGIREEDMEKLVAYHWPGNVRELENVIERGVILSNGRKFHVPELISGSRETVQKSRSVTLKEMERQHILWALQKTGWKVRGKGGAAELLDINPSTLGSRMKKLGIERP